MPRRKKPWHDIDNIDPAAVIDFGGIDARRNRRRDWHLSASLVLRDVPPDRVEQIGHACALAVLKVLDWPDDKAALMAERVRSHITARFAEEIEERGAGLLPKNRPDNDLDDGIPF